VRGVRSGHYLKGGELAEWRSIPGFSRFEASTAGGIRRCSTGRMLTGERHNAYIRHTLTDDLGVSRAVFAHALVLMTFVGPCPPGMEARHFPDRKGTNNALSNLSWGTKLQNANDRRIHNTSGLVQMAGRAFGQLVVERLEAPSAGESNAKWLCRCACGGTHVVRADVLRAGKSTHCPSCSGVRTGVSPVTDISKSKRNRR
jgi:hypothetical protein